MGQVATLSARLGCVDGQTRLLQSHSTAPLKISRLFPQKDGSVEACVMDASPGLLEGDQYALNWHLEAGACARVTTQGFSRIHPCKNQETTLSTRIQLEPNARLIYAPEATLPFSDARLNASAQVEMSQGSQLILLESLCAGRTARGETWQFTSLRSRLNVKDEKGVMACQQLSIRPTISKPTSIASWGDFTQSATLWAFLPEVSASILESGLTILEEHQAPKSCVRCCGSTLARDGLCVTIAGYRAWDVREVAHKIIASWQELFGMFHVKHEDELK